MNTKQRKGRGEFKAPLDNNNETSVNNDCNGFDLVPCVTALKISQFPASFKSPDVIQLVQATEPWNLKWVDDTTALALFSSSTAGNFY